MSDNEQQPKNEIIEYTTPSGEKVEVPIVRANMSDLFAALKPPDASPYVMAPRELEAQKIVEFFSANVAALDELRQDMKKRFAKSSYGKCRYQTGDVAYVMGRPFQLRVYPLGSQKMKGAARGRATSKFSVNAQLSLITLYVVHPKNYDEARIAFSSYAEGVLLRNAIGMAKSFSDMLKIEGNVPPVRMRAMRGRWSSTEAGCLWISTDLIPYPPDCLVYVIWREIEKRSTLPDAERENLFHRILPGWENAGRILAQRPEPYCLQ